MAKKVSADVRSPMPADRVDHSRVGSGCVQRLFDGATACGGCPQTHAPINSTAPHGDGDARDHSRRTDQEPKGEVHFDADF